MLHGDHRRIAPIWNDAWQARVQMAINDHGKHRTVDEMMHQRIGDYDAFKEYQRAVFDRTEAHLATIDPGEFTRVLIKRPFPPQVASTYSARCAGPDGITVLDGFECWLYQHGLRHMGEIELARARRPRRHDLLETGRAHRLTITMKMPATITSRYSSSQCRRWAGRSGASCETGVRNRTNG